MNLIVSYKILFPNITLLKVLFHKSYYLTSYNLDKIFYVTSFTIISLINMNKILYV